LSIPSLARFPLDERGNMRKVLKIFAFFVFFFASFASIFASFAYAADLDVICNNDGCNLSSSDPLFSFTNIYPGWSAAKTVKAVNNYDQEADFSIETVSFNDPNGLGDVLNIAIKEKGAGSNLYNDSLTKLDNDGNSYRKLSLVSKGKDKEYEFIVSMLTSAGDRYQEKQLTFNLNLGFELIPVSSPPSGASPSPSPGVGGAAASPSPSPPLAGIIFPDTGIGGFIARVLGVEEGPEERGEVGGAVEEAPPEVKGEEVCDWYYYLWWLPLLVQAVLTGGYYYWLDAKDAKNPSAKNAKIAYWWSVPLILSGLSQIIHEILGCECVKSKLCPWYWLFNLIILISLTSLFIYGKRNQNN